MENLETEERVKALEDEFMQVKGDIKQLMLDIRALLMEAWSPLRNQSLNGKVSPHNDGGRG